MTSRIKKALAGVAVVGAFSTCAVYTSMANAATPPGTKTVAPVAAPSARATVPTSPVGGGASTPITVGKKLTGASAAKVKAAALKAVPHSKVTRVETAANKGYAAHVTTKNGKHLVVTFTHKLHVVSIKPEAATSQKPVGVTNNVKAVTVAVTTAPLKGAAKSAAPADDPTVPTPMPPVTTPGDGVSAETAAKIRAAARDAVPDATVDSVGATADGYEARLTRRDGAKVLVTLDRHFTVIDVTVESPAPGNGAGGNGANAQK